MWPGSIRLHHWLRSSHFAGKDATDTTSAEIQHLRDEVAGLKAMLAQSVEGRRGWERRANGTAHHLEVGWASSGSQQASNGG